MGDVMHYASGYSLDLYCDCVWPKAAHERFQSFPSTYVGETFAECAREAKEDGWRIFRKTRTARCPKCVAARIYP